jgi:hypothetical protein
MVWWPGGIRRAALKLLLFVFLTIKDGVSNLEPIDNEWRGP